MTKQWTVHPHRTSPHQDRPIGLLDGTTLFPEAALPSGFRSSPNWADFETLSPTHGKDQYNDNENPGGVHQSSDGLTGMPTYTQIFYHRLLYQGPRTETRCHGARCLVQI